MSFLLFESDCIFQGTSGFQIRHTITRSIQYGYGALLPYYINLSVVNSLQLCGNIIHKHLGLSYTDHVHKGMGYASIAPDRSFDARLHKALPILFTLISQRITTCGADEGVTNPCQISLKGAQESLSPRKEGRSLLLSLGSPMISEVDDAFPVETGR